MFLNDHQIALVEASFAPVIEHLDGAAALFYHTLYERDPSLESLFRRDQGRNFLHTLSVLVSSFDNPTDFIATSEALGRRAAKSGVKEADYGAIGEALLDMLQLGLGEDYTPEIDEAWAAAYRVIASIAISAAYEAAGDDW
jgi:hemoglobin-like flavoprotein